MNLVASDIIFYVFAGLAVLSSLGVVLLRNPIMSAMSLIVSFFCVSGIFVLLNAAFLGVIQVLIYAGAILVLFLYVLMLMNLQEESWLLGKKSTIWRLTLGVLVAGFILYLFKDSIFQGWPMFEQIPETFGGIQSVGLVLLKDQVFVFELLSLVLLVGIVGVVALSNSKEVKS